MNVDFIFEGVIIGITSGLVLSLFSWVVEKRKDNREKRNDLYKKVINWCNINVVESTSDRAYRFEAMICPHRNNASKNVKKKIDKYCACVKQFKKEWKDGYEDKPERLREKHYASLKKCDEAEKEICELINKELL